MVRLFPGWQRRLGSVILIVACLMMAGAIRARHSQDVLAFSIAKDRLTIVSSGDTLFLSREFNGNAPNQSVEWKSFHMTDPCPIHSAIHDNSIFWRFRAYGFGYYDCVLEDLEYRLTLVSFPYLALTLPLTLLAASLLVTKARSQSPPRSPSDAMIIRPECLDSRGNRENRGNPVNLAD